MLFLRQRVRYSNLTGFTRVTYWWKLDFTIWTSGCLLKVRVRLGWPQRLLAVTLASIKLFIVSIQIPVVSCDSGSFQGQTLAQLGFRLGIGFKLLRDVYLEAYHTWRLLVPSQLFVTAFELGRGLHCLWRHWFVLFIRFRQFVRYSRLCHFIFLGFWVKGLETDDWSTTGIKRHYFRSLLACGWQVDLLYGLVKSAIEFWLTRQRHIVTDLGLLVIVGEFR